MGPRIRGGDKKRVIPPEPFCVRRGVLSAKAGIHPFILSMYHSDLITSWPHIAQEETSSDESMRAIWGSLWNWYTANGTSCAWELNLRGINMNETSLVSMTVNAAYKEAISDEEIAELLRRKNWFLRLTRSTRKNLS